MHTVSPSCLCIPSRRFKYCFQPAVGGNFRLESQGFEGPAVFTGPTSFKPLLFKGLMQL